MVKIFIAFVYPTARAPEKINLVIPSIAGGKLQMLATRAATLNCGTYVSCEREGRQHES